MSVDKMAVLQSAPLLREFTEVGIRILAEASQERSVARGTYAFRGGDASDGLSFVTRGTLQLLPRDGGQPLGEVGAGDTVGGLSLLVGGEHFLSALAATDVELLDLTQGAFEQIKQSHPRTALKLTLALAQDLAERLQEAKAPLREFLVWQISKRQPEGR